MLNSCVRLRAPGATDHRGSRHVPCVLLDRHPAHSGDDRRHRPLPEHLRHPAVPAVLAGRRLGAGAARLLLAPAAAAPQDARPGGGAARPAAGDGRRAGQLRAHAPPRHPASGWPAAAAAAQARSGEPRTAPLRASRSACPARSAARVAGVVTRQRACADIGRRPRPGHRAPARRRRRPKRRPHRIGRHQRQPGPAARAGPRGPGVRRVHPDHPHRLHALRRLPAPALGELDALRGLLLLRHHCAHHRRVLRADHSAAKEPLCLQASATTSRRTSAS